MPQKVDHRNITPVLSAFRRFLRGKEYKPALRFAEDISTKNPPPPEVPGGPYHKTSKIYYYMRDARREVAPPEVIADGKRLIGGSEASKAVTPNKLYLPE